MAARRLFVCLLLAASAGAASAQSTPAPPDIADAPAGPGYRAWLGAEYLLWKVPGETTPVLVGTIPAIDAETSRTLPPGTIHPLFGGPNAPIAFGAESGWRLDGGCWLDPDGGLGLEARFFQLPGAASRADFRSGGNPVVGPIFQDAVANQPVLVLSSIPGLRTGDVHVAVDQSLWGGEFDARRRLGGGLLPVPLDLLIGFRYLQVDEGLDVSGESGAIPNGRAPCG
jgi:hypothetical protein